MFRLYINIWTGGESEEVEQSAAAELKYIKRQQQKTHRNILRVFQAVTFETVTWTPRSSGNIVHRV